jgi:hypothetical protein
MGITGLDDKEKNAKKFDIYIRRKQGNTAWNAYSIRIHAVVHKDLGGCYTRNS